MSTDFPGQPFGPGDTITTAFVPSVDVLAAQVRERIELFVRDGFRDEDGVWWDGPHKSESLAALDALVARVTEAERHRDQAYEQMDAAANETVRVNLALADARNALERIAALDGSWDEQTKCLDCGWDSGPYLLPCAKHDVEKLAREVLARLDGSSE